MVNFEPPYYTFQLFFHSDMPIDELEKLPGLYHAFSTPCQTRNTSLIGPINNRF